MEVLHVRKMCSKSEESIVYVGVGRLLMVPSQRCVKLDYIPGSSSGEHYKIVVMLSTGRNIMCELKFEKT